VAQMIRKQVYIEPRQEASLKRLARILDMTEAEIIRQALDRQAAAIQPGMRDLAAWEREKAFIAERMAEGSVSGSRRWRRDEIYEERLSRYGRQDPG
jgi:hypothetical protein